MWEDFKRVFTIYQDIYKKYLSFLVRPLMIVLVLLVIIKGVSLLFHYSEGYLIVLFKILLPFVLGYLISFFLEPVNQFLIRKTKIPRTIIAPFTLLFTLLSSFLIFASLLYHLYHQAMRFIGNIIDYFKDLNYVEMTYNIQSYIINSPLAPYVTEENLEKYAVKIQENLTIILKFITNFITETGGGLTVFAGNLFINIIPSIIIIIFISLLTTFFITKDYDKLKNVMETNIPNPVYEALLRVKSEVSRNIVNYFKGQLSLVSVSGFIFFVAFLILQSPYALIFALICMVLDLFPVIGTILFVLPYALYALFTGDTFTCYVLIGAYLVATIVRQIIEPKIMGSSLGIHPLLFIASIYIGGLTLGAFGVLFGPLFIISIKILIDARIIEHPYHYITKNNTNNPKE